MARATMLSFDKTVPVKSMNRHCIALMSTQPLGEYYRRYDNFFECRPSSGEGSLLSNSLRVYRGR